MKKTLFAAFAAFALITSLFYLTSCEGETDPCAKVECGTHGTCNGVSGTCDCAAGYETDINGRCDLQWSQKFAGTYAAVDTCKGAASGVYIYAPDPEVKQTSKPNEIEVKNFGGFNITQVLTLTDGTKFNIDFTDATKRTFKGSGKFVKATSTTKDIIKMTYRITYSDNTFDDCIATYTRK